MRRKIGVTVIVLVLGVMFVGELIVLSAQTPAGSTIQKKQSSNDATGENPSTGIPIFGIHFKPTIRLDMSLSILIALLIFIIGNKTRSKTTPEPTAEEANKPENANKIEEYIKKVDRNPNASLTERAIADAYILQRSEKIAEAIEKWRSIANIAEGNDNGLASRALVSIGYLHLKEGTGEQALLALDRAIDLRPDYDTAYNNRGAAKTLLGRHQDAIADYDTAIRLKPDYAEAYSNRGTAKNFLGRHQDAIADYNKAIRLKPDYVKAYDGRGSTKHLLGRSQDAIADYNKAIQLKADDAQAYYHRGHANKTLEKYEEAFADYDKVIDLRPDYAEVYDNRGFVQFRLGRYREAITDYSKVIQLIKSSEAKLDSSQENSISLILKSNTKFGEAEAYYNRGSVKSKLGEYAGAVLDYDEAIRLKPDYADAYNNRGNAKIQLKQTNEALADFNEAIRIKPDYADAYNNRGGVKIYLKQPDEALADFNEAIRTKPDYAKAYNNRGGAKIHLKQSNEALTDLNEAIRIKPDYAEVYANRGEAKVSLGISDAAKSDFQTALELAEQQKNNDLKIFVEAQLQQLNDSRPQDNEN